MTKKKCSDIKIKKKKNDMKTENKILKYVLAIKRNKMYNKKY